MEPIALQESESSGRGVSGARPYLLGSVLVSATASVCCLGPLFLLATGLSAAWIGKLMFLEAYTPLFAGVAGVLLLRAAWLIYVAPSGQCVVSRPGATAQAAIAAATLVSLVFLASEYWILFFA